MKPLLARLGVVLLVAAAPVGVYLLPEESPYPEHWDARVLDEVRFVEQTRGLAFEHPVPVEFLDDEAFEEKVGVEEASTPEEEKDDERFVGLLRALGLVDADFDLRAAVDEIRTSSVVGVYVPEEQALYVRGTELTPYVRSTLVHELTHALQDQHFDLGALLDDAPDGAELGVQGLVEGDALRVEAAWDEGLSDAERAEKAKEEGAAAERADAPDVPAVLEHVSQAPYVFGPWLLDVLVEKGRNGAVDDAFRRPPTSEAQLVDPLGHPLSGEPVEVAAPQAPAGATDVDDPAAFGQVSLFEVLGTRLGHARAWAAVRGWSGDSYVTYDEDDRTCVAASFASSDASGAASLAAALDAWGAGRAAEVSRDGVTVGLRVCEPEAGSAPTRVSPDAFEVLAGRIGLAHFLVQQQGVPVRAANCLSTDVVRRLGDAGFADANDTSASPEQTARVARAFQESVAACQRQAG